MTKGKLDLYYYTPSFTLAVTTVAVFAVFLAIHSILLFRTRTWFCTPFVIGALCEVLGFGARAYSHSHVVFSRTNAGPLIALIIQAVLILLAPLLYAASVYMFLGRIIRAKGGTSISYCPIPIANLTKIFVWADFICLNLQSTGASLFTNAKGKATTISIGRMIVLVGLGAQILASGFFVYVAVVWHRRVNSREVGRAVSGEFDWRKYMRMLYVVSIVITSRNVYRVAEFALGQDGYLNSNEWPTYAFDALPMAVVLAICAFWYVGNIYAPLDQCRESMEMMVGGEPTGGEERPEKTMHAFDIAFNVFFLGIPWILKKALKKAKGK